MPRLKIDVTNGIANPGGAISINISDRDKRTPFWICYTADASSIEVAPSCSQAGSATQIISSGTQCTRKLSTSIATLTWVNSSMIYLRARACTIAGDNQQIDNKNETLISTPIGIRIDDTILNEGDNVTLELDGHVGVTPTWVCYRSNVTQISSSPQCKNYGSAMSIKSIGSGSNVVCTEARNDGSSFGIKWSESNQSNIWARACTSNGDAQQRNNENVELKLSILTNINISLSDYRAGQSNVIMTISFDTTDQIPPKE